MSAVTPHFIKKFSNGVESVVSYLPDGVLGQTFCLAEPDSAMGRISFGVSPIERVSSANMF